MKSTGEVMGIDADLGLAYAKSQMAAPPPLPKGGNVFISVKDDDKEAVIPVARRIRRARFRDYRHKRDGGHAAAAGIPVTKVYKIREGRPNVLDRVKNGDINFIINTPSGKIPREDEVTIRNAALAQENSDHDDGARGAGERERNSFAAEKQGARCEACRNITRNENDARDIERAFVPQVEDETDRLFCCLMGLALGFTQARERRKRKKQLP